MTSRSECSGRVDGVVSLLAALLSVALAVTCAAQELIEPAVPAGAAAPRVKSSVDRRPLGSSSLDRTQPEGGASVQAPVEAVAPLGASSPSREGPREGLSAEQGTDETGALRRFHEALAALAEGKRGAPLRILWLGDSHTAADTMTHAVRHTLGTRVPLGGPGYLPLGLSRAPHHLARVTSTGSFEIAPHPPARREREADGVFGLGGVRTSARAGASVNVALLSPPTGERSHCTLVYRGREPGARLSFSHGEASRLLETGCPTAEVGGLCHVQLTAAASAPCRLEIKSGRVQLFGMYVELESPGLILDTLGINGARLATPLAWDEASFVRQVAQREPELFVIAYGTNEVFDDSRLARHATEAERLIRRIRQGAPDADCFLVGPTAAGRGGEERRARALALDQALGVVAKQEGCAHGSPVSLIEADGGFGAWLARRPALAAPDGVHLTPEGYRVVGEHLGRLLLGVTRPVE